MKVEVYPKRKTFKTTVYAPCGNCGGLGYKTKVQDLYPGQIEVDTTVIDKPTYQETCVVCMGSGLGQIKEISYKEDVTDLTLDEKMKV